MKSDGQVYLRCDDCGAIVNSSEERAHRCPRKLSNPAATHMDMDGQPLAVGDRVAIAHRAYMADGNHTTMSFGTVYSLGPKMASVLTDSAAASSSRKWKWNERGYYHGILKV